MLVSSRPPNLRGGAKALPLSQSCVPWSSTFNSLQDLSFTFTTWPFVTRGWAFACLGFRRASPTPLSHVWFSFTMRLDSPFHLNA